MFFSYRTALMNGILAHSINSVKILLNNKNVDVSLRNAVSILILIVF